MHQHSFDGAQYYTVDDVDNERRSPVNAPSSSSPELVALKARQQQAWAAGDYQRVAATFVLESELLCEALDLAAGQRVLDVAGGSGNAALAAARRFADVTCTDYVPKLLERAAQRAEAEGLQVTIRVADAEQLPFPDATFDVVLSAFGVMFTPNQEQAAREILRVCRPGGKIGLANWTPEGFAGAFFGATARHLPSPSGVRSPLHWGTEAGLRELFSNGIQGLTVARREHVYRFRSPEHFIDFWRANYGPTQKVFEGLEPNQQEQLARELAEVVCRYSRSDDGAAIWPGEYLEVVAVRS